MNGMGDEEEYWLTMDQVSRPKDMGEYMKRASYNMSVPLHSLFYQLDCRTRHEDAADWSVDIFPPTMLSW